MKRARAFSLIELIITLAISSIVVLAIFTIYLNIKTHYLAQQALIQTQENARLAIHLLRQSAHTAGFMGCLAFNDEAVIHNHTLVDFSADTMIRGYRGSGTNWQPSLPNTLTGKVKADSDVLQITGVDFNLAIVSEVMQSSNQIVTSTPMSFKQNEVLVIADCQQAELFVAANVRSSGDQQIITSSQPLSKHYQRNASVGRLQTQLFYIRDSQRKNLKGDAIFSLYSETNGTTEELVAGIENLRLYFALSHNGNIAEYLNAAQINDWQKVVALDILLLSSSEEEVSRTRANYDFDGQNYAAPDGRLRKMWPAYIKLQQRSIKA